MKIAMVSLSLFFLSVGCAGSQLSATTDQAPVSRGDTRWETCFPGRHYSEQDIALMLKMRDDGAGRADVAKRIGGTRQDIRCAEARARGRIRTETMQLAKSSRL
jgi:hypothetical protein